ncbi:hypothetical protein C8R44DRAFT_876471 [Mycena epipterygia]|nr:hypothetical protein C8R44DRAFT_876471 [Mycena epipterygia]
MFSAKFVLAALAFVALSSAAPVGPTPLLAPTITVCTGSISPRNGCVDIPVVSESCINFTGGLTFLNKEVSHAQVPGGFVCTFFEDFGCINGGDNVDDVAVLTGGTYTMFNVQGINGAQNFNDLTSSISCSPL